MPIRALEPSLAKAFDDLAPGETFATAPRTVTEADIFWFAVRTGDDHPHHIDAAWAESAEFGERIAPGALTLSYALGLVRLDPEFVIALRRLTDVVFTRPVTIGDAISVSGRLTRLTPLSNESGLVTCSLYVSNQEANMVCRARLELLWRRWPLTRRAITQRGEQ